MNKPDLVIFFDGQCPLCCNEMRALKTADHQAQILLVDVHDTGTMSCYPSIDKQRALSILHGIDQQGQLLYGLDVTVLAWRLVNRHRWLFITRLPILKRISDRMYLTQNAPLALVWPNPMPRGGLSKEIDLVTLPPNYSPLIAYI
ncbi:cell division inhibitor [Vibrio cholerae TMA 21]|nr:cell division inhibitor [Vibrio cholerae TMA 21]